MPDVMTRLRREHAHIVELLGALERQLARFDAAEEIDYDILLAIADYFVDFPDCCHHPKEDVIFRRMCEREPALRGTMTDLLAEHIRLGEEARHFHEAVDNVLKEVEVPRDVFLQIARRFIDDQRGHLRAEEERFFPKAEELLTSEDWEAVEREVTDRIDPVFGGEAAGRFAALHDDILEWQAEDEAGDRA